MFKVLFIFYLLSNLQDNDVYVYKTKSVYNFIPMRFSYTDSNYSNAINNKDSVLIFSIFNKYNLNHIDFIQFKNLEVLYIQNINIHNLNDFSFSGSLKCMILDNNKIEDFPTAVYNLKKLRLLNLSSNCIESIDFKKFKNNDSLMELDVSSNKINKIKNSIKVLKTLDRLELGGNPIKQYHSGASLPQDDLCLQNQPLWRES